MIVDHNSIGMDITQFEMAVNQFTDMSEEEFIAKTSSGIRISEDRANKMKDFKFNN